MASLHFLPKKPLALAVSACLASCFALPVFAKTAADQLETLVVTAGGFEQNISDAPASISVISAEELNKKSYTSVLDAIKNIPGVYMVGGGSMGDISVRGMTSGYTLMLVDGRPISAGRSVNTNGTDGGKQIGLPPISLIDRIEVIRGPMSSLYGSDAMGGVVNIITKKNVKEWNGSINTEWTHSLNDLSNDEQKVDLTLGGGLIENLLGIQLNASWQGTDESDFSANSSKADASKPEGKNKEIGGKFILTPNADNDISLGYTKAVREYSHNPGKSLIETANPSHTHFEKDIYLLAHDGRYGNFLINSYLQQDVSENISTQADSQKKETITTFNTQATTFIGRNALTFGGQYKNEEIINETNGLLTAGVGGAERKLDRWLAAIFAEIEWNLTQDLAITTGLRYNDDEYFGSHFSPRIYGVYHLTEDFTLKGGVSTGYKQPSLTQASKGFGGVTGGAGSLNTDKNGNPISRALIIGNKDLTAETSTNFELGYVYGNSELGLNTSLMLFLTKFDDKIAEDRYCTSNGASNNNDVANYACELNGNKYYFFSSYKNIDEAEMKGAEFTLDYQLIPSVTASISYTYTDSEQKTGDFKGQALNKIPKHMTNINLDWQATEKLASWVQYNYRGKTTDYLSRTSMEDGTPGYGFIDAGLAYQIKPGVSTKFGIYNLANKEVTNADYGVVLDGRRFNLGLTIDF